MSPRREGPSPRAAAGEFIKGLVDKGLTNNQIVKLLTGTELGYRQTDMRRDINSARFDTTTAMQIRQSDPNSILPESVIRVADSVHPVVSGNFKADFNVTGFNETTGRFEYRYYSLTLQKPLETRAIIERMSDILRNMRELYAFRASNITLIDVFAKEGAAWEL